MATMTDNALVATAPTPAKYSRYRSVRKASTAETASAPPVQKGPQEGDLAKRSMSRYRRTRPATNDVQSPTTAPVMPQMRTVPTGAIPQDYIGRRENRMTTQIAPRSPSPPPTPLSPQEEEARLRRAHERTQAQRLARQKAEEEEAHRILAEQKRKDLERLEATLAAAVAAPGPISPQPATKDGKFKIFGRKRSATKVSPPGSGVGNGKVETRSSTDKMSGRRVGSETGIVGMDAPVSAVNAGERVRHIHRLTRNQLLTHRSESSFASNRRLSTSP